MNSTEEATLSCECKSKVRARTVSAIVRNGYLTSHKAMEEAGVRDWNKVQPVTYDVLEYCQRPTCEKVYRAERKSED